MRSKMFGLLIVLVLLLGTFGSAFAQDAAPAPICGDLAAEDCALLAAAQTAMMDVQSYKAVGTYDVSLTGIPGLPAADVKVAVTVDGAFSFDDAAHAAALGLAGKTQEQIMAVLAEDPQPLLDLIGGWDADAVLSVEMTPELAQALSAQAGVEVPTAANVGIKLVDGVLYADLTEVAPLVSGLPEGWIGIPALEMLQANADAGVFAQAAAQMDPTALDPSTAAALGAAAMVTGGMTQFEQYLTVARLDDTDVDGNAAAVFETKFDLGGLVTSPEFAELVKGLVASGALGADAPSPADIEQGLQMLGMMGPMLFQGLNIGSTETVGLDPNYIYQTTAGVSWDLTSLIQMAAMSGQMPEGLDPNAPIAFDLQTSVTNSDIGGEQTIEAPADAMMIPIEAFQAQQ